jgi:hypothetical protein
MPPALHQPALCCTTLLCLLLAGCATERKSPTPAEPPLRQGELRDLSGHWEKNYQLSDDFDARFSLYIADIQRVFINPNGGSIQGGPVLRGGGRGFNPGSISDLARFTQELTRMPLLDISQSASLIEIARENDFTLRCDYQDRQFVRSANAFGSEICGWAGERMQFQMSLGGGLSIAHQFSMSADASMLNVTTTVSSDTVPVPMVISNYYERYTPAGENYNCMLTLTRSRVCSQRGTPR